MTRTELIDHLRAGRPVTAKVVKEIVGELEFSRKQDAELKRLLAMQSDYDELRELVAWMLECEDYLLILNPTNRWRAMFAYPELRHIVNAAREAVEELP